MQQYASAMLYFNEPEYWLTEFSGDWAKEAGMSSQQLQYGKKIIDTKLGSRAAMHTSPFFEVGLDGPVKENSGEVLMGTLGWTGNFRFTFEVDNAVSYTHLDVYKRQGVSRCMSSIVFFSI